MKLPYRLVRNVHLAAAPFIGALVYSDALRANETFVALVQWGVFPLVAGAGIALWLGPRLTLRNRASRRDDGGA
jgi:hypothetical protein